MSRFGLQLLLVLLLVSFGVFYGVDLATKGTERIHGPLPLSQFLGDGMTGTDTAETTAQTGDGQGEPASTGAPEQLEPTLPPPPSADVPPSVELQAWPLQLGQMLQTIALWFADVIVSLYEAILH